MNPMRINVAYAVSPQSRKSGLWHDGFTAGMDGVARMHDVRWLNLHPQEPSLAANLRRLADCDFLLVKSNWNWIVDKAVREHCRSSAVPKGLLISGVAPPPSVRKMLFYDVLFYQTHWYAPQLAAHPLTVHSFGIDTRVMWPDPQVTRDIDWLSVGQVVGYKRPERLLECSGRRVMVGDLSSADPAILETLRAGGVEFVDFVDYETLATYYRRARQVLIPCTLRGGGERAVLEARACGAVVQVADDNPKLQELAGMPTVWDHRYYGEQLLAGMLRVAALPPERRASRAGLLGRLRALWH